MAAAVPFTGEQMCCLLCGKTKRADPAVSSNWRMVEAAGRRFYACPEEFPADGASEEQFQRAYYRFLRRAIAVLRGEN